MGHAARREAIRDLEESRDSVVISYVTSVRSGAEAQMGTDAIAPLYRQLRQIDTDPKDTRIDLFIVSNGGDGTVPWRMVNLIRTFCEHFAVLVPSVAFSAATLTALGADEVLMHPMGNLGPIDPSIMTPLNPTHPMNPMMSLPVAVEDVASYIALVKEDVGIRHEDELIKAFLALVEKVHPLTLGVVKRSTAQGRMLGDKLLRRRKETLPPSVVEEILRKLTSELYFHGHPINAREANEDIGLTFVSEAPTDLAAKMWALYEAYNDDLHLDRPFEPTREAIAKNPLPVPAPPAAPVMPAGMPPQMAPGVAIPMPQALQQQTVQLDPLYFAIVEGYERSEGLRRNLEVTLLRDHLGNYQAGPPQVTREGWVNCTEAPPAIDLNGAEAEAKPPNVGAVAQGAVQAPPETD